MRDYTVITNEGTDIEHYFDKFKDAKAFAVLHAKERGKGQIIDVSNADTGELLDWYYKVSPTGKLTKT